MAVIFVTHDIGVAVEISDRIAVMYAGRIVESGTLREVVKTPSHPYTRGLLVIDAARRAQGQASGGDPGRAAAARPGAGRDARSRRAAVNSPPVCAVDSIPLIEVAQRSPRALREIEERAGRRLSAAVRHAPIGYCPEPWRNDPPRLCRTAPAAFTGRCATPLSRRRSSRARSCRRTRSASNSASAARSCAMR